MDIMELFNKFNIAPQTDNKPSAYDPVELMYSPIKDSSNNQASLANIENPYEKMATGFGQGLTVLAEGYMRKKQKERAMELIKEGKELTNRKESGRTIGQSEGTGTNPLDGKATSVLDIILNPETSPETSPKTSPETINGLISDFGQEIHNAHLNPYIAAPKGGEQSKGVELSPATLNLKYKNNPAYETKLYNGKEYYVPKVDSPEFIKMYYDKLAEMGQNPYAEKHIPLMLQMYDELKPKWASEQITRDHGDGRKTTEIYDKNQWGDRRNVRRVNSGSPEISTQFTKETVTNPDGTAEERQYKVRLNKQGNIIDKVLVGMSKDNLPTPEQKYSSGRRSGSRLGGLGDLGETPVEPQQINNMLWDYGKDIVSQVIKEVNKGIKWENYNGLMDMAHQRIKEFISQYPEAAQFFTADYSVEDFVRQIAAELGHPLIIGSGQDRTESQIKKKVNDIQKVMQYKKSKKKK